ncbi:LOW QUALITY PROTEIN: uncharacterized protein LOC108048611 [Drosophila rhopaloa]|uniref:Glutathione S-transferase 1-like n=2 Tax=Drosophila rhopaloa TaxID=1041015 RepID=A0ABM5HSR0_DRORH|nr:LOW QUALITY PROTEIN: uncharacterized protein LOC108048611 [Drosophila rhopaloa]
MGKISLYGLDASPPTRACLLTLKALDIPFDFVFVNLFEKENYSEEYSKKNPQHTVPLLQDDDACIWDSHAIMAYLVGKYAASDELYPKDLLQRAKVDQLLHFESGVIFESALRRLTRPILFNGESTLPRNQVDHINQIYDFVEAFLDDHDYLAGDQLTIADFSIVDHHLDWSFPRTGFGQVSQDCRLAGQAQGAALLRGGQREWSRPVCGPLEVQELHYCALNEKKILQDDKMVKLTLYGLDPSPPVRAVKLTLAALNLPYEFVNINIIAREQLSSAYLEKNPQHTVPTLEDDGHFIWDSHAIIAYLVSKYADTDSLYPKDLLQRAVVDQRLHFESGVVFADGIRRISKSVLFLGETKVPKERYDAIIDILDFVETFLKGQDYIAGNQLTIADFSLISSVTSLEAFVPLDPVKYPRISAWIKRLEQLPYYEEANGKGVRQLVAIFKKTNFSWST